MRRAVHKCGRFGQASLHPLLTHALCARERGCRFFCYSVPEAAWRWLILGGVRLPRAFEPFLAAYIESSAQLRLTSLRLLARLPKPPFVAIHARRGERARRNGCRALERERDCATVTAQVDAADRALLAAAAALPQLAVRAARPPPDTRRWLVVSDDARTAAQVRAGLAAAWPGAAVDLEVAKGTEDEPRGVADMLDFFALTRASTIIVSMVGSIEPPVPDRWTMDYWTSYSYAAHRLGVRRPSPQSACLSAYSATEGTSGHTGEPHVDDLAQPLAHQGDGSFRRTAARKRYNDHPRSSPASARKRGSEPFHLTVVIFF